jgi:hypothetical protein
MSGTDEGRDGFQPPTQPGATGPRATLDPEHVYDAIGENLRYFLSWRSRLLVGYFGILAALAVAFAWLLEHKHGELNPLVLLAAAFLTEVFKKLEVRNRDAYRACLVAGAALELKYGIANGDVEPRNDVTAVQADDQLKDFRGIYTTLRISSLKTQLSHSDTLDAMFDWIKVASAVGALFLFLLNLR